MGLYIYLYPLAPASLEGGVYTVSYTFLCLFNSVLKTFQCYHVGKVIFSSLNGYLLFCYMDCTIF